MSQSSAPAAEPSALAPVAPEERIAVLDVLRGFALLGILIMNLPGFNTPTGAWVLRPRLFPGMADRAAEFVMTWLVAGKANAIFSFLFGLGMTIQMQRAASRGGRLVPVYLRRLAVLFAIGAVHGLLIWNGDVLHVYAVLGLLLLALRRASDRVVFGIIALCIVAPVLRSGWALYVQEAPMHPIAYWVDLAHKRMEIFQHGSYSEQLAVRVHDYKEWYGAVTTLRGTMWWYVSFTITMLFGFYAGRKRLLENVAANAARIRKATLWCLGVGLSAAVAASTLVALWEPVERPTVRGFFTGLCFSVSRPLLCVAYIGAIALLLQKDRIRPLWMRLTNAGRMPLTNYLMQSVIATTLFYSYGFGLFGKVGPALGLVITAAIFAVQVMYSNWWMERFRFGPLEWLWRGATYGKLPELRAESKQPVVVPA